MRTKGFIYNLPDYVVVLHFLSVLERDCLREGEEMIEKEKGKIMIHVGGYSIATTVQQVVMVEICNLTKYLILFTFYATTHATFYRNTT